MAEVQLPAQDDPFDAADYNPIHHLNSLFSHPSHLSSVRAVSLRLRDTRDALDRDITSRTQSQRRTDAQCVQGIQAAQAELSDLFERIESVQTRALETERSITDMTAEIKRLDSTKRNLTHSMTTLKRLQMLTSAFEQLRALKNTRQYRECAGLLAAVIQLMTHFRSYRGIGQIADLSRSVADLQRELLEQVCEDFEMAFAKGEIQLKRPVLAEACLVVDALGDYARQRLTNWYCNTQLREYRQVFRGSEEAGSLDNIGRRYSWFGRMLKTYDAEHAALFPKEWRVNELLANAFCEGTREDYKVILHKTMRRADGQPPDVNLLLSCLSETLEFEGNLEKRFKTGEHGVRASLDSLSSTRPEKPVGFTQAISEAFEPYLSIWVESQDRQLSTVIPQYRTQPIKNPEEEYHSQMVIPSSTELFHSYRITLAQCAKLSTGGRFLELSRTFAKYLDLYCQQVLFSFLAERGGPVGPSVEEVAIIINTADYCYQTTNQLEERIKQRIDEGLKEQVDLQAQADAFMGIASAAVRVLVRKVEIDCEPAWREMRNVNWSKLQSAGDQSPFMTSLIQRIRDRSGEIMGYIHKPQYSRAFSDNLVDTLITAYVNNIVACRPISESAAEQMLLDSYGLKSGLLALSSRPLPTATSRDDDNSPVVRAPEPPQPAQPVNPGLARRVQTSMARLDPFLKTLQVQPSPPEALVQAYLIHIHDRSEPNFKKVLELKGITRAREQAPLVELFNAHKESPSYSSPAAGPNKLVDSNPVIGNLVLQPSSDAAGGIILPAGAGGTAANRSVTLAGLGLSNTGATHSTPNLTMGAGGGQAGPTTTTMAASAVAAGASSIAAGAANRVAGFDPMALGGFGEKILTSAVDRFGSPASALSNASFPSIAGFVSPTQSGVDPALAPVAPSNQAPPGGLQAGGAGGGAGAGTGAGGTINENLRKMGNFFKRDGSGFGGRRAGTPDAAGAGR